MFVRDRINVSGQVSIHISKAVKGDRILGVVNVYISKLFSAGCNSLFGDFSNILLRCLSNLDYFGCNWVDRNGLPDRVMHV